MPEEELGYAKDPRENEERQAQWSIHRGTRGSAVSIYKDGCRSPVA